MNMNFRRQLRPHDFMSMDQIEDNLYLGNFAVTKDIRTLCKHRISHIITINEHKLHHQLFQRHGITVKHIDLSDLPKENLLDHLDHTYMFIERGMTTGGCVFVHCTLGISRSATVVIGYIMKKYQIPYKEAYDRVKAKRSVINPNYGFISQLRLYHEMGYTVDKSSNLYKQFQLSLAANGVKQTRALPVKYRNLISEDPGIQNSRDIKQNVYCCKGCKRVLATESNLLIHKDAEDKTVDCKKTYFIEPLAWMKVVHSSEGKLVCPGCSSNVGSFSWIRGHRCTCGERVAPAFVLCDAFLYSFHSM